ncbi:MAG: hypothetical protein HY331_07930 [Chloroflexi bacterium]|nr:hypothetical protein [Chloroflexota bacterium]
MLPSIRGVVRGKRIELEEETGLPPGSEVIVAIRPRPLTLEEKRRLTEELCGTWAADDSLPPIFAEIERIRDATLPRDVDFDATP